MQAEKEWLKAAQAAKLCGVSETTMRKKMASGEIPGVTRIDRNFRIRRDRLESWLESKTISAPSTPAPQPNTSTGTVLQFPNLEQFG